MKINIRKMVLIMLAVVLAAAVLACRTNPDDNPDHRVTAGPEPTGRQDVIEVTPRVTSGEHLKLFGLHIYTVNATTESVINQTVMLSEDTEITPALLIDYISEALKDESINLSFESVEYEDGCCVVDFDDSIFTIASKSASLEDAVLDAIAQSILDNVDGCLKIIYRIKGAAYSTVNRTFDYNYVYMDN